MYFPLETKSPRFAGDKKRTQKTFRQKISPSIKSLANLCDQQKYVLCVCVCVYLPEVCSPRQQWCCLHCSHLPPPPCGSESSPSPAQVPGPPAGALAHIGTHQYKEFPKCWWFNHRLNSRLTCKRIMWRENYGLERNHEDTTCCQTCWSNFRGWACKSVSGNVQRWCESW